MLYLIAGNGSPNFGDELIVQNWLRYYREIGYKGPITVDGKGNKRSEKLLRGFGDVRFVTEIPRHSGGLEGTYGDFYEIGKQYAETSREKFRDVIAFHFLGGGYVSANWLNATRLLGAVTCLGKNLSVPVVATGLGIAPFKSIGTTDSSPWRDIVTGCLLFECRDQESYDAVAQLVDIKLPQLSCGLDDAFLFHPKIRRHSGKWLHLSGFSQASIFGGDSIPSELFDDFDRVVFWTCSPADAELHAEISQKFPIVERYSNERLLNEGLPLVDGDFMVTGRFHPHLMAARTGLSGYYTIGSGFYKTKHGLVTDLGSPFRALKSTPKLFTGKNTRMLACESGRVEEKQRVAKRVAALLGL